MVYLLEGPFNSSCIYIHCHDRSREIIVAGAVLAENVRSSVSGVDVNQPQRRIDGWNIPYGGSSSKKGIAAPGVRPLCGKGPPDDRAGTGIKSKNLSSDLVFSAGEADNYQAMGKL